MIAKRTDLATVLKSNIVRKMKMVVWKASASQIILAESDLSVVYFVVSLMNSPILSSNLRTREMTKILGKALAAKLMLFPGLSPSLMEK